MKTKIIEVEDPPVQISICKRSTVSTVPSVRDSQARKNPFRKLCKHRTAELPPLAEEQKGTQTPTDAGCKRKPSFSSLEVVYRARGTFERVPKPSSDTEAAEEDEIEEQKAIDQPKKAPLDTVPPAPDYALTLTKEVEYNFKEIEKIGVIPEEEINIRRLMLPEAKGRSVKKTLLLDLDDTLAHTLNPRIDYEMLNVKRGEVHHTKFTDPFTGEETSVGVVARPYADHFLRELRGLYEIVVFLIKDDHHFCRYLRPDARATRAHCCRWSIPQAPSLTTFCAERTAYSRTATTSRTCGSSRIGA
ncbi:MAG: NIF family HAD-type phosphatase [Candidatus Pacebacteria bacterium]|nr:NIF family HAD-type phosphatase [Candidatus Paceibacterota bacterium]